MDKDNVIFHIDLDAFFASCEERENPHFRGKPIVVGADPKEGKGRGVVSTANYIARKFGIHSAMPISQAYRLCPQAIFLPPNSALYNRVSSAVMAIIQNFAQKHNGAFKQVSIDEAYFDLGGNPSPFFMERMLVRIASDLKHKIQQSEKITASVGIGPNMLIAKMACEYQKPDGLTIVEPHDVQKFLDSLPVRKIPGIGPKTEMGLKKFRVKTIEDLRKIPRSTLYENFGRHGVSLYESARGVDNRNVAQETETQSISREHTFEKDTSSAQEILPILFELTKNVLAIAHEEGYENVKTITIKVRYADFKTHTKSLSGKYNVSKNKPIETIALKLFWPFLGKQKIRLVGFRVSGFL